jgi:hypothetical protein
MQKPWQGCTTAAQAPGSPLWGRAGCPWARDYSGVCSGQLQQAFSESQVWLRGRKLTTGMPVLGQPSLGMNFEIGPGHHAAGTRMRAGARRGHVMGGRVTRAPLCTALIPLAAGALH